LERQGLSLNERLVRFGEATPGPNGPPADDGQGRRPGLRNARELLTLPPAERPTAIFCATYYLTLDVVDAVKERQRADAAVDIPGWLSLMGFDKLPMFEHSRPRIAHVYYDLRAIGRQACHKLLDLIENPSDERALTDVVVRAVSVETGGTVARPATDPEFAFPLLEPAPAMG
jgi:LacI family transcriptional regulator